jgi:hypothetical protein
MASDETGDAGFPGFKWVDGFAELWVAGAKDYMDAWNRVWEGATDRDTPYSFGRWAQDMAKIWAGSYRSVEKLAKYPVLTALGGAPVWATISIDQKSESAQAKWVDLPKTVGQPDPTPTALEGLTDGHPVIPVKHVKVDLNDTRDRLLVTIKDLKSLRARKEGLPATTYVGFVKQKGASGAPLAVIFVSVDE